MGFFFLSPPKGEKGLVLRKNTTNMITIDYLKKIMRGFVLSDGNPVNTNRDLVDAPDIQEGLTQLCQKKELPIAILFEEAFHYDDDDRNDVPYTRFEQSIYVMRMVRSDKGSRAEELKCFEDVKRIRALLLKKQYEGDEELKGWNRTARRDFVSGAANYVGWKLKLPFTENDDWTL